MATFELTETMNVPQEVVVFRTDDPAEAEAFVRKRHYKPRIRGHHPSHDWSPGVGCVTCGAPDNGCRLSYYPCGEGVPAIEE